MNSEYNPYEWSSSLSICSTLGNREQKKAYCEKLVADGRTEWRLFTNRSFKHIRAVLRDTNKCAHYIGGWPVVYVDKTFNGIKFYRVLCKNRQRKASKYGGGDRVRE